MVEGFGAGGFQEVGQGLGGGDQAVQDVEGDDQVLVEDSQVAGDGGPGAAALDGVALRVGVLAQAEGRVVADSGQDGGGEQGQMVPGEGGQGPVLGGLRPGDSLPLSLRFLECGCQGFWRGKGRRALSPWPLSRAAPGRYPRTGEGERRPRA